jgi:hypothetical protein
MYRPPRAITLGWSHGPDRATPIETTMHVIPRINDCHATSGFARCDSGMTVKPLHAFRLDFPGCEIVVLADIAARTALSWDSALKWPQERIDEVAALAVKLLGPAQGVAAAEERSLAILARDTGCHVFVRAGPGASEVLCSVFAPGAVLDGVVPASRRCAAEACRNGQESRPAHA